MTASGLFEFEATSLAQLPLASLVHFSLQFVSETAIGHFPEMLNQNHVWTPAETHQDGPREVLRSLLRDLGHMLWFAVLLNNEPSPQSEVKRTLEEVLSRMPLDI